MRPAPPWSGAASVDFAIVGGGYTGMWTAWHLKRLEPNARVVVFDAGVCGHGPSGRNGGFVNALWFSLPTLRRRFGDDRALEVARAAQAAVDGVGEFCAEQGVDAWFRRSGYMQVSTAPGWDGAWGEGVAACHELGVPEAAIELGEDEVTGRCASPVFRGGAFYPLSATVQPARLALGLRQRLLDVGVELAERSPVYGVSEEGPDATVWSDGGSVLARAVILASGGDLLHRGLRRRLTVSSSHMVVTEPVPELLEEIGWTGGESVTDSRAMIHYFRTTPDGRIAFGWGGGRPVFEARTGGRAEIDPGVVAQIERTLFRFFPGLAGKRVELAWGGPVDVSPSHLPVIGSLRSSVHYGFGYTGNGVGPSHMVGRSLASIALDRRDAPTRLAIVEPEPVKVPPEPLRYLGGMAIRRALLKREAALDEGRRPGLLTEAISGIPERVGVHVGR